MHPVLVPAAKAVRPRAVARSGLIRTAVVGLGWAARTIWLPLLNEHPDFQVTAVADPDAAARAHVAADGGSRAYADASGLSPDDIDLAVVAVPNRLHAAIASTLLARGIPVFLEKPVCLSSGEAAMLADAERRGGTVLLAGSAARYRSDIAEFSRLTGSLGTIRHLDLSWIRARGIPEGRGWFTQRRFAGGGALVDLGWHLLDIGLPLLGAPAIRDVLGAMSADFLPQPAWRAAWRGEEPPGAGPAGAVAYVDAAAGDVEDGARALLITEAGVTIVLHVCWASHRTLDVTQIAVEGTAGAARLDCTFGFSPNRLPHPSLTVFRQGHEEQVPLPAEPTGIEYARQVDALPTMLTDPGLRGRAIAEAARTVAVIERLYQAAPNPRESERKLA
jgi:oxidoreductase